MDARIQVGLLAALAITCGGCGTVPMSETSAGIGPLPGPNATSGMVLSGPDLSEHGGTLLRFLHARIPGMTVDYGSPICPRVHIRGRKSLMGSSDPVVYLDGARSANSCVLDDLLTKDLQRVEIYPMGVSNRPGYEANPNGLILVFARNGTEVSRHRLSD